MIWRTKVDFACAVVAHDGHMLAIAEDEVRVFQRLHAAVVLGQAAVSRMMSLMSRSPSAARALALTPLVKDHGGDDVAPFTISW